MGRWMSYYFEQKKEGILSEPFSVDDAIPKPVCGIMVDGILGATEGRLFYKWLYY